MLDRRKATASLALGLVLATLALPLARGGTPARSVTIRSDADFLACACVSGGDGSAANPYRISGLTLSSKAAPGILVDNTKGGITNHFIISEDTVTGGNGPPTNYPGVEFMAVDGLGAILGGKNTFNGNLYGILLMYSSHILIDGVSSENGATMNNNHFDGISIVGGGSNTVRNLKANHNGVDTADFLSGHVGIALQETTGNTVRNVVLSEDEYAGLALYASSNNLVDGAIVHYPDFYAAVVDGGSGNTIENSVFQTADYVGLWIRNYASGNIITGNSILANGPIGNEIKPGIVPYFTVGLYISSGAHDNMVRQNTFNNGNTGGSIIVDDGQIVNAVQVPIQSNNPFNDPKTGNEPRQTLFPSGPSGDHNAFCGNLLFGTQGPVSNPAC